MKRKSLLSHGTPALKSFVTIRAVTNSFHISAEYRRRAWPSRQIVNGLPIRLIQMRRYGGAESMEVTGSNLLRRP